MGWSTWVLGLAAIIAFWQPCREGLRDLRRRDEAGAKLNALVGVLLQVVLDVFGLRSRQP